MKTITNVSYVTDYSGEPPIVTYSNPVTTVINQPSPSPIITRIFYSLPCNCNCCVCECSNGCNFCGCCNCQNCNCNCCDFECCNGCNCNSCNN